MRRPLLSHLVIVALALFSLGLASGYAPPALSPMAIASANAQATTDATAGWGGVWSTRWRDGGARMTLQVDGARVVGSYTPGNGRIEAEIDGRRLTGIWIEPTARGGFDFTLAPDGRTFTGRFDNGEWWTGSRLDDAARASYLHYADSPRAVMRILTNALNRYRGGEFEAVNAALAVLEFGDDPPPLVDRIARVNRLFDVLDLLTYRIWRLPGPEAAGEGAPGGEELQVTLTQAGTPETFTLAFHREPDHGWRLLAPPALALESAFADMLAHRGELHIAPNAHLELAHPRATMRTFIKGLHNWDDGGRAQVASTFDLSDLPPRLRDFEIDLLADYLRRIIDRVGFITWQELPDDPDRRTAYVHFEHPIGRIELAPVAVEAVDPETGAAATDRATWRFTTATLRDLPALYDAVQDLEPPAGLTEPAPFSGFFELREELRGIDQRLIRRDLALENWQWVGLAVLAVGGLLLGLALKALLLRVIGWLGSNAGPEFHDDMIRQFSWPLRLFLVGGVWIVGVQRLGLPGNWFQVLGTASLLLVAIGGTLFLHNVIRLMGITVRRRAEAGPGIRIDDVFSTLGAGLLRFLVIILGIIVIADILGLPYEGVIASIGISGLALAIAARETVANFFGAATLLADRPFRKGDFIDVAGQMGTVEMVGLRSTQIRNLDDSIVVYPNGKLADATITNLGRRRQRRVLLEIGVTYDTPAAKLDAFTDRLRETFRARPNAVDEPLYIGVQKFGASSIDIMLWGYLTVDTYGQQVQAQHALVLDIVRLAEDMGVAFAFPTRTVHVHAADDDQRAFANAAE